MISAFFREMWLFEVTIGSFFFLEIAKKSMTAGGGWFGTASASWGSTATTAGIHFTRLFFSVTTLAETVATFLALVVAGSAKNVQVQVVFIDWSTLNHFDGIRWKATIKPVKIVSAGKRECEVFATIQNGRINKEDCMRTLHEWWVILTGRV